MNQALQKTETKARSARSQEQAQTGRQKPPLRYKKFGSAFSWRSLAGQDLPVAATLLRSFRSASADTPMTAPGRPTNNYCAAQRSFCAVAEPPTAKGLRRNRVGHKRLRQD